MKTAELIWWCKQRNKFQDLTWSSVEACKQKNLVKNSQMSLMKHDVHCFGSLMIMVASKKNLKLLLLDWNYHMLLKDVLTSAEWNPEEIGRAHV